MPPFELFRLRRCFRQGRVHQHRIRADGLDLLPWNGQAIVPAKQSEQPWPPQQDQALQPGGGRVKGQVVGPAKAAPLLSVGYSKLNLFGEEMVTSCGVAARALNALAAAGIEVLLITTSDLDISLLVRAENEDAAYEALKKAYEL